MLWHVGALTCGCEVASSAIPRPPLMMTTCKTALEAGRTQPELAAVQVVQVAAARVAAAQPEAALAAQRKS